jgi:hypothetical protein
LLTEHPWLQNAKKAPNVPLGDIVRSRLKQFSVMNRFKKKALRVSISSSFVCNYQLKFWSLMQFRIKLINWEQHTLSIYAVGNCGALNCWRGWSNQRYVCIDGYWQWW